MEETVDETFRMLGREHELDLEREAQRRGLAAAVKADHRAPTAGLEPRRKEWAKRRRWTWHVPDRLASLFR
jgi:hypothetical protein